MRDDLSIAAASPSERDSVLREVEHVLTLARSVSLGPEFDDIIRTAVERATDQLMAATRRRTARLAALAAIQQAVGGGFDFRAVMSRVYAHLSEILDAPSLLVTGYDAEANTLQCAFAVAGGLIVREDALPTVFLNDGPLADVIRQGRPRIVNDVLLDHGGRRPFAHIEDQHPIRAIAYVPMLRGADVIGVIQAQSYRPGAYGPEDVDFLATIANQAAMALENARLYQEALRRSREVEALLAAAQEINDELAPERVLRRVIEAATHLVDAEVATIGIAAGDAPRTPFADQERADDDLAEDGDETAPRLRFAGLWQYGEWRDLDAVAESFDPAFRECVAGRAVRDNAPGSNAAGPLRPVLPPLSSRLVVPVLGRGQRLLGVIALFNKRNAAGFTPRDLEITAAFASYAATAIDKANAYRTMEQSRNYLQTVMDSSYSALFVLDPARGVILDVNAVGAELLNRQRADLLGVPVTSLAPAADRTTWRDLLANAPATGAAVTRELHLLSADDLPIPLDLTATLLPLDDAPTLVCLARDRRPRLRREQAERLRALGEMASGVAHDFNNLLGVIVGHSVVLRKKIEAGEADLLDDVEVIRRAALDGAETVKRLQAFSGVTRLQQHDIADVNRVLRDAIEFTRPRWRDAAQQRGVTIEVTLDTAATLPPAAATAADLREVLVNMLFNAIDALPHGGRIALRSWEAEGRVYIGVSDSGIGMTESVKSRIFEPFFTTKDAHGGAGLGLSASYGIIARLGGRINVESEPFHGTTFTIDLPIGEARETAAARTARTLAPQRLLVVDDEPQMLRTTRLMLEIHGHRVEAVTGGQAALAALDGGVFDAVLTDLGMPGMNGLQLAEALRSRGVVTPLLLITGWGLELDPADLSASGVTAVLPKPFDAEQLQTKLADLLITPAGADERP